MYPTENSTALEVAESGSREGASLSSRRLSRRAALGLMGAASVGALIPARALASDGVAAQPNRAVPTALTSFSNINNVPVYYGHETSTRTWSCTPEFLTALNAWGNTVHTWSGVAVASLGSAGFYVNKSGQHGLGRAMDLSIVRWTNGAQVDLLSGDHASSDIGTRRRYLAVDATTRHHFRYVLDGWYNAAHTNHIHADFGAMPANRLSASSFADTVFVQAACRDFIDSSIAVDGDWGPLTTAAVNTMKSRLGVTGDIATDQQAGAALLHGIANHGFQGIAI